jgi:hypothetical protein
MFCRQKKSSRPKGRKSDLPLPHSIATAAYAAPPEKQNTSSSKADQKSAIKIGEKRRMSIPKDRCFFFWSQI